MLIVTDSIVPALSGMEMEGGARLNDISQLLHHRVITDVAHGEAGKITLQIRYTDYYSYQPQLVAPSAIQAAINRFTLHALTHDEILHLIDDFARYAQLARQADYDGVEVMGSEGYLINQFLTVRTSQRDDEWGGDYANCMHFTVEVVRAVRFYTDDHRVPAPVPHRHLQRVTLPDCITDLPASHVIDHESPHLFHHRMFQYRVQA